MDGKEKRSKNLIPFSERSEEEAFAIRSKGGKASQEARKKRTQQSYLLGKLAQAPIVDKRTVKKFENLGYEDEDINRALEITWAIFQGAKKGDPRMIEIYLRLTGEKDVFSEPKENNLLSAICDSTKEDIDTDDLPELQQKTKSDADVVEPPEI